LPELELGELAERLVPAGVSDVRPLAGGASSLTYAARLGDRNVVVKVAPPGVAPILHRDVLRQARLIRALSSTAVPVPEVLWEDAGSPPAVPPLFVMSYLEGTSIEPLFDVEAAACEGPVVAERMRNAARTMADLHSLDPGALPLGHEPHVGLEQEIVRWCRLLETVDPELVPGWPTVAAALRASVPPGVAPAVVHGDFRLGNLLSVGPRINAIIDWEIWSVGDPRVDAGWFLLNADPETYRRPTPYVSITPRPAELASIYESAAGRPVTGLDWFQALASFKSAATWSLIVKHNRRRSLPDADTEAMAGVLPHLLHRATELLARY
jgi:aminoglycoside phosphotransferase (APT) family kinase protein